MKKKKEKGKIRKEGRKMWRERWKYQKEGVSLYPV